MKTSMFLFILTLICNLSFSSAQKDTSATALIIIDVQNFYFPGSDGVLVKPEEAAGKARLVLDKFREKGMLVIHVKHNAKKGAEIYNLVTPLATEKVISKDEVNSFYKTDLLDYLKSLNIKKLIICGMMTHMCVEAATRAGHDFGFDCTVLSDACTTRDLKFGDKTIPAEAVHFSTLATLTYYAKVINVETYLKGLN